MNKITTDIESFDKKFFKRLKEVNFIFADININYKSYCTLEYYKDAGLNEQLTPELYLISFFHYKLVIIDLYKLLSSSNNDRFSLYKTLNFIISNDKDGRFDKSIVSGYLKNLGSESMKQCIEKVSHIRSTRFAHLDQEHRRKMADPIYTTDLSAAIQLCENIVDYLNKAFRPANDYVYNNIIPANLPVFYQELIDKYVVS